MSKQKRIFLNVCLDIVLAIAIICTIYFAFFSFCFFATHVEGDSMLPTYNAGETNDRVLASRISGYERGDIVIIHTSEIDKNGNEKYIIKRVIALGGDSVDMAMKGDILEIYVNGEKIEEDQYSEPVHYSLPPSTFLSFEALKSAWSGDKNENGIIIPEGQVFVLGDNREVSQDSATRGPYLEERVVAKVLCKIDEKAFAPFELLKWLI